MLNMRRVRGKRRGRFEGKGEGEGKLEMKLCCEVEAERIKLSNNLAGDVACLGGLMVDLQPRLLGPGFDFLLRRLRFFPFLQKLHFQFPFFRSLPLPFPSYFRLHLSFHATTRDMRERVS